AGGVWGGRRGLAGWRGGVRCAGGGPLGRGGVGWFRPARGRHGVDPSAAFCVFGMAEATLAVTFPTPGSGMHVDAVDQRVLETDQYAAPIDPAVTANVRRLPRLGRPLDGMDLRISDPASGQAMRDREVGEIELRGTSIPPGYYGQGEATREPRRDEWFRTGDLGYIVDGELVVCGRLKDVIIVGGRNVFPEDVERAAASVEGVRPGNV